MEQNNFVRKHKKRAKELEVKVLLTICSRKECNMRKILWVIGIVFVVLCSCNSKKEDDYSTYRHGKYQYYVHGDFLEEDNKTYNGLYTTWEHYMWDEGFPDSIIVRFTRNGKFEGYITAERSGAIRDEHGNEISPAYIFMDAVGHTWTYDLNGRFIKFKESRYPHNKSGEMQYKP